MDLEEFADKLPFPLYALDEDGKVKIWNKACEEYSGVSRGKVVGSNRYWILYGDKVKTPAVKLLESNRSELEEILNVRGRKYVIKAFRFNNLIFECFTTHCTLKEVTEYVTGFGLYRSKDELREAFSKFTRNLIGVEFFDVYMKKTKAGKVFYKLVVRNPDIKGDEIINEFHPLARCAEKDVCKVVCGNVLTKKLDHTGYVVPLKINGKIEGFVQIFIRNNDTNLFNSERFNAWKTIISIVIKRLKIEEELKEKENLLRNMFNVSREGVLILDENLKIIEANKSFKKLVGLENLENLSFKEFVGDETKLNTVIEKALRNGRGITKLEIVRRDSTSFNCLLNAILIVLDGRPLFVCSVTGLDLQEVTILHSKMCMLIAKEKSYNTLLIKTCSAVEKSFSDVVKTWCFVCIDKPKLHATDRKFQRVLEAQIRELECLKKIRNDKLERWPKCEECLFQKNISKTFKGYHWASTISYKNEFYGMFGVIFKRKPKNIKIKALENIVNSVGIAINRIIVNRRYKYLLNAFQEEILRAEFINDKMVNPFAGSKLMLETLVEDGKLREMSVDEIEKALKICLESMRRGESFIMNLKNRGRELEKKLKKINPRQISSQADSKRSR